MSNFQMALVIAALLLYVPPVFISVINLFFWSKRRSRGRCGESLVSILIPARDEEQNIERCVAHALDQGSVVAEILIYNDRSVDGTQEAFDRLLLRYGGIVKQVATQEIMHGWVGKTNACARLAEKATGKWLLFLDADTTLRRNAVESMVIEATHRDATLLSAWPKIEMLSLMEKLLMPLLNFVVFSLFPAPISRFNDRPSLGLAHGACILAYRETYLANGGHRMVKDRLFEDTALARSWRSDGQNSQVMDGSRLVSVRMYSSLSAVWNGFSKSYYPAFENDVSFLLFQSYLALGFILLPLIICCAVIAGFIENINLLLAALSLAPRAIVAIMFGHSLWSVLLHPVSVMAMLVLGTQSWWRYAHGSGVAWKGRQYSASGTKVNDE
tara:strand:+ start:654 stop:1808 length:1155 start_codon:yes stop_codon:yes gene_type:complete